MESTRRRRSHDTSINRNIVECKLIDSQISGNNVEVLIETLWNVNIRWVRDLAFLKLYYINRSIVECKETSFQKIQGK